MQTTQSLPRTRPLNLNARANRVAPGARVAVATAAKPSRVLTLAQALGEVAVGKPATERCAPARSVAQRAEPQVAEGCAFAAKRLGYVLELVGSCMMIAAFLALALFV